MTIFVPFRHGKIHFVETMHSLIARVGGVELPEDQEYMLRDKLIPRLARAVGAVGAVRSMLRDKLIPRLARAVGAVGAVRSMLRDKPGQLWQLGQLGWLVRVVVAVMSMLHAQPMYVCMFACEAHIQVS